MNRVQSRILEAARAVPPVPTLGLAEDESLLRATARRIVEIAPSDGDFDQCEKALALSTGPLPVGPALAIKIARSLAAVAALPADLTLWVTFAMFREVSRMQHPSLHRSGEDFLRNKISQLDFLFSESPADWSLIAVDDACPEGSGRAAEAILRESFPRYLESGKTSVLFLDHAVAVGAPEAAGIGNASASVKGGSILYGLRIAHGLSSPGDVLLYTDADLSAHLGQAGILLGPLVEDKTDLVAGSRREKNSFQIKSSKRSARGRLFIHLWKRMLPLLTRIIDSQAAFKAFRADRIATILGGAREIGFAFDIELLLLAELAGLRTEKKGICWIDSENDSSTASQEVHLTMLKTVVAFRRRYLPPSAPGGEIALQVEGLEIAEWEEMAANPPQAILDAPLERLGDPALI
jgi:hypothetical protein